MATANEEAAKRLMKREQFPAFLLGYSGEPFINHSMIPPLHSSLIEKGFDVYAAVSVMDETVENSYLDAVEIEKNELHLEASPVEIEKFAKTWKSRYGIDKGNLVFSGFPFWNTFVVQNKRLSPYGDDSYLVIDAKGGSLKTYHVPEKIAFQKELSDEYGVRHNMSSKIYKGLYCENTGWRTHNVDGLLSVFYKNIVIAMNNAAVANKYGKI